MIRADRFCCRKHLLSIGFQKSEVDPNLYFIVVGGDLLILLLYVDDLFITREEHLVAACKRDLASEFEMIDLGLMHYYLGMEVWREDGHVFLGQGKYAVDVLKRFQMECCRPISTSVITNWKRPHAFEGELGDPTLYR